MTTDAQEQPVDLTVPAPLNDPRWEALAAPFPDGVLEWKPQPLRRAPQNDDERRRQSGRCQKGYRNGDGKVISADDYFCGGYHMPAIHLAYVGHAELTMRLNEVCSPAGWDWQPVAVHEDGTPKFTDGGLWIRLTILGHTKLGFGDPGTNTGTNATKETIGDALRNAGIRFGIATYLWSKSERSAALKYADATEREDQAQSQPAANDQQPAAPSPGPEATGPAEPPRPDPLTEAKRRHRFAISRAHPDWTEQQKYEAVVAAFNDERTDTTGRPTTMNTATPEDWHWLATYWEDEADSNDEAVSREPTVPDEVRQ